MDRAQGADPQRWQAQLEQPQRPPRQRPATESCKSCSPNRSPHPCLGLQETAGAGSVDVAGTTSPNPGPLIHHGPRSLRRAAGSRRGGGPLDGRGPEPPERAPLARGTALSALFLTTTHTTEFLMISAGSFGFCTGGRYECFLGGDISGICLTSRLSHRNCYAC